MVDVGEKKKSPEGKAAAAAACGPIRCLDVVKWLVRKCERDNDRLCMTPLGAPNLSCELASSFQLLSDALGDRRAQIRSQLH